MNAELCKKANEKVGNPNVLVNAASIALLAADVEVEK